MLPWCHLQHPPGGPIVQSDIMKPEIAIDPRGGGSVLPSEAARGPAPSLLPFPGWNLRNRGPGMLNPQPSPLCRCGGNQLLYLFYYLFIHSIIYLLYYYFIPLLICLII